MGTTVTGGKVRQGRLAHESSGSPALANTSRVLVIEAHPEVRDALRVLLQRQHTAPLEVVGMLDTLDSLPDMIARLRPDLLLMDWELAASQKATLATIRARFPGVNIVALSVKPEMRQTALSTGADAFVSKGEPAEGLLQALVALT
ncbi:MAG: response regulator transcription factor [Chloroflexota bacterium]